MVQTTRYLPVLFFATALCAGNINYEAARLEHRLKAVRTTEKIIVDGRLDEATWSAGPLAASFTQNEPREDQPASQDTEVRVLYDNDNLYFGVSVHDSEPDRLIISELKKDFSRESGDVFEIILDTFHDERNGYWFAINPAGAKWDAQMANEGREVNVSWDGIWYVKTRQVGNGWTAEIAIPFKTLKFRNTDVQTWGINFSRSVRRKNEDSFWSPLPRIYDTARVSLAGTLEDLEGVKPGANLKVKPYLVASRGQIRGRKTDYDADFGVDAKYGITTGLTWDFTYNTDFSQVEADDQQINLTRFSLFFPEKREFFLENSGIFQFSGGSEQGPANAAGRTPPRDMIFFHSRRIGLSDAGEPIPILGGTRLTGRAGPFELGFLNIQQREQGDVLATNFTVARLRRNLPGRSDVGVMFANKEVQDSPHYNRVLGADANLRFSQALSVYSYVAKTFTPSGGGHDLAGRVALHYVNNTWDLRSAYTRIQEDFNNEMGFVPRRGIAKYAGIYGRAFRPPRLRRTVRRIFPHIGIENFWDAGGALETRTVDYHLGIDLQDGSYFEPGINASVERLRSPFVINRRRNVVVPPGLYRFHDNMLLFRTNSSRRISGNFRFLFGPFYTGFKHTYEPSGTFRLNHKFKASFSFTHNNISLPQGHFKTNLLGLRFNYSFSTIMFLNAFIQYNSDLEQWSSNVRFNVIHRPLSDFFLVYNERRDSNSGSLIDRALIAKFTYMIAR